MFSILIAASTQDVRKEDAALSGIDNVLYGRGDKA
jgi:hypothetical protein